MRQIHVPDRAALQLGIPCSIERKGCLEFLLECQRRLTQPGDDWSEDDLVKLESFDLLFWNPFSAALMWAHRNIYLSLEGGLATMTFGSETTAVLHIYNALKQRGLVDDDLPLLSDIDEFFSELKWFWNGWEKPEPGKFVYRYHLCMGAPNELATWEQDMHRDTGLKALRSQVRGQKLRCLNSDTRGTKATGQYVHEAGHALGTRPFISNTAPFRRVATTLLKVLKSLRPTRGTVSIDSMS